MARRNRLIAKTVAPRWREVDIATANVGGSKRPLSDRFRFRAASPTRLAFARHLPAGGREARFAGHASSVPR